MLTDVPVINQKSFKDITKLTIRNGGNVLVIGPSGGGKTFIAKQAAEEEGCRLVYINLSVLERTDFQGFPVISNDKTLVSYATPDFLPFTDTSTRDERNALSNLIGNIDVNDKNNKSLITWTEQRIAELNKKDKARAILSAASWIAQNVNNQPVLNRFKELASDVRDTLGNEEPIVVLFDEVDKALTETTQTLLEFLQFGSINGRQLNVKACILTGNLPDEHAHVNQISHAISKRCKTFQLELNFNQWREWAFKNNVYDHIIQYLSSEPSMLYQKAPDGDVTAYALPSPRTWTDAAESLYAFDTDLQVQKLPESIKENLRMKIVAGCVGDTSAIKFNNWYKYYRKFDPIISSLVEEGIHPNINKLTSQEILIMAISATSKLYAELRPNNTDRIHKVTTNVYDWINTLPPDIQMGSIRLGFGGDSKLAHKYGLAHIDAFKKAIRSIKNKMDEHEANLSNLDT